ncbi:MAG: response regulator transcription factor [Phenylobacterium sp.]|uniref:response regulator transcription factor n=1 Tax=Phenylobacterium sp. TaxID=1871053 RepID=UPI001B3F96C0|nr:response regulator transcription factor [Phenylobacterium sp.]MBP7651233.1 response regulator transcription factor [Phenylobacterium sp.]MBP7817664.1 response regulator transcription factor [Phenylobacterium sp.]MBP9230298.1 response regulator transcription factor [Phenylobacterium sp.]MBP9754149.1 response regulator transcription factor [Phenylobacterium sp.]
MNIAVLDDDQAHNDLLAVMLRQAGHRCTVYERPPALLADLRRQTFDLLIMDWNMPEMTGIDVLARLPELLSTTPPVLLVTSRSVESDVVEGLNAGADDYLVKPFEPSILLARVAALLRRAYPVAPPTSGETHEGWTFDPAAETASRDGKTEQLTSKEFQLALTLFRNMSRALSRDYLLERVWGHRADLETRTLDAHISRLRGKLALRPAGGFRLVTVYGFGYRLERCQPVLEDAS